jgi:glycosyltransferase involved in cell wall biosynthesis
MDAPEPAEVAIVIPSFNQARFLSGAIESAVAQTLLPREIIVVDDGSSENVGAVIRAHPSVRLIRQDNRGLAGARNAGLRAATTEKVIFLDSDDRLLPEAIAAGLDCFAKNPRAAFVYGAHRIVRGEEKAPTYFPVSTHRAFIRCNWVGMVATVLFDRASLGGIGGFDERLGMCEDWDVYLRLSRAFPFASHDRLVADYLKHSSNASNDLHRLWKWIEVVRANEWDRGLDPEDEVAWHEGEAVWESLVGRNPAKARLVDRAASRLARLLRPSSR